MRLALAIGYRRLEEALLAGMAEDAHRDDAWRHNEPTPIAPMSPAQALQLLYLHQKEAALGGGPDILRRRRGETPDMMTMRLMLTAEHHEARRLEADRLSHIAARQRRDPRYVPADDAPVLPALDQVTGWSKASGQAVDDAMRALFGGWRIGDWEGK